MLEGIGSMIMVADCAGGDGNSKIKELENDPDASNR